MSNNQLNNFLNIRILINNNYIILYFNINTNNYFNIIL